MTTFLERPRYQCALGGALSTINAIGRAVAVVHAAPGCASISDAAASMGSGYWGAGACGGRATPSTNLLESDVVFGGEKRLGEQIQSTIDLIDADLYAIITGCVTDIIGDDVRAIAEEYRRKGRPVIIAETGGFKGNSIIGHNLLWKALIDQYIESRSTRDPKLVNLLGLVPSHDVFWRGDLLELKRLLASLGLATNSFIAPFEGIKAVQNAASASVNLVLSEIAGQEIAAWFEQKHGVPSLTTPLPIGPTATDNFLRTVGNQYGIDSTTVERVIRDERRWYYGFIQHVADLYNDQDLQRNVIIIGNSTYVYSLTRFLADDFSWIPYCVVVTDILDEPAQQKLKSKFDTLNEDVRPKVLFETDTSRIRERVLDLVKGEHAPYGGSALDPCFLLGSSLDRRLAADLRAGFLSVSYPIVNRVITDQGYAGFRGGLRLATDILSELMSNR